jgi:hypothetical protein
MARLLCRLGVHGPIFYGHGLGVSSPRNYSVGPGHRKCTHCGVRWLAYERASRSPYREIGWDQFPPSKVQHSQEDGKS